MQGMYARDIRSVPSAVAGVSLPSCSAEGLPAVLVELLPPKVQRAVQYYGGRALSSLEEIRLRAGRCASLTMGGRNIPMPTLPMTSRELFALLTKMCGGSLYAYSDNINQGFLTLPGGVRVGVVGHAACEGGRVIGVHEITSLCIRVPRRHAAVGRELCTLLQTLKVEHGTPRGLLIYAPPGVGKTTLLRGVAAELSGGCAPLRTVIIDTRGELAFETDAGHLCLDVLSGYPRPLGVEIATRTMGAEVMVCDEIGEIDEAKALVAAQGSGVPLVASAHAAGVGDLLRRTGVRLLHDARLFGAYVGIRRDGQGGFIYHITTWEDADHDL